MLTLRLSVLAVVVAATPVGPVALGQDAGVKPVKVDNTPPPDPAQEAAEIRAIVRREIVPKVADVALWGGGKGRCREVAGRLVVYFVVAKGGHVQTIKRLSDSTGCPTLFQRIRKLLKRTHFPDPGKFGTTRIEYPFTFGTNG